MAFPASRPASGALTTQALTAYETFQPKVRDIASTETILLGLADLMGFQEEGDFSHHEIEGIIDEIDATVTSFKRFDTLPTQATRGAVAAYWGMANYATPVTIAWEEEQEYAGPMKLIDGAETRFYKAGRGIAQRLETDLFTGSQIDTNNIDGLEQAIHPKNGVDTALGTMNSVTEVLAAARWQFRQTTSTYAGVARAAYTSATAGGTGWENLSGNMSNAAIGATLDLSQSSGTPSDGLKIMAHFYYACRRGGNEPDLLISTGNLWEQYENAAFGLLRINTTGVAPDKFTMSLGNRMFKSALWAFTDKAAASGIAGDASTAGWNQIYFLNTSVMRLKIKNTANMALSEFVRPSNMMAVSAQMVLRLCFAIEEPGLCGVLFGFGN